MKIKKTQLETLVHKLVSEVTIKHYGVIYDSDKILQARMKQYGVTQNPFVMLDKWATKDAKKPQYRIDFLSPKISPEIIDTDFALSWTGSFLKSDSTRAMMFDSEEAALEELKTKVIPAIFKYYREEYIKGWDGLTEAAPPPVPAAARAAGPQQGGGVPSLTPLGGNWETGTLEQDAQKVLQANRDKLAKKGINVDSLKKLGVGTMGVAYDMGGKVLKVTKDKREAQASSVVAGKNIPNIVQVYDIWKFPGIDWYGLVIEKLNPLTDQEAKALTSAVVNEHNPALSFPYLLAQAHDDWNAAMQQLARGNMQLLVKQAYQQMPDADPQKGGQGMNDPRVQQFVRAGAQKIIENFNRLTKEYNMRGLFKSLKSLGIQYYDFHGGNYGRRADGTLVLFDLGRSISKGAMPAELKEAMSRVQFVLLA